MSISIKIPTNDTPTMLGDALSCKSEAVANLSITNNTGESIQYSINSGGGYTTLTTGNTANLGNGLPSQFVFRRSNSGGYPLAIDATLDVVDSLNTRWSADGTALLDPQGGVFLRGTLQNNVWATIPSIFRLRLTGTGTVVIDAKDALDNVTTNVSAYVVVNAVDQIEFPYAGDDAVAIRATLTGTATAEVI